MKQPKILLYDIESTPNQGYTWGKWQQNVIAFKKERELLSYAYKWADKKKVTCVTREGQPDDKRLVVSLAKLLQEADIVIAHNGDEFDRKIVKARMLFWGMKPLKTNCSVDTKKAAKLYFNFNGNGLQDLCSFLGIGSKLPHQGFGMWVGCMEDDAKAWENMIKYNKHDVVLLDAVYKRMLPWIENHPSIVRIMDPYRKKYMDDKHCPACVSKNTKRDGFRYTLKGAVPRMECYDCGKHWQIRMGK